MSAGIGCWIGDHDADLLDGRSIVEFERECVIGLEPAVGFGLVRRERQQDGAAGDGFEDQLFHVGGGVFYQVRDGHHGNVHLDSAATAPALQSFKV